MSHSETTLTEFVYINLMCSHPGICFLLVVSRAFNYLVNHGVQLLF